MKRTNRTIAAFLGLCLCLSSVPMQAAAAPSLPDIIAEADTARTDYRIRMLDFPDIDRSDLTEGLITRLPGDLYALQSWGVFHAEGYKNTPNGRGPYHAGTAIVNRRGELFIPWQPTMAGSSVHCSDGVYSIVNPNLPDWIQFQNWKQILPYSVSEYYDADGNVLFAHEPFAAAGQMQDGVAWAAFTSDDCDAPQVKLIDKTGKVIADLSEIRFRSISDFSEGLAQFCRLDADGNTHYGYLDRTGQIVLESEHLCGDFHNGLAWVRIDGKYGFMDTSGKLVIPAEYDALGDSRGFTSEAVLVKKGEYWALIGTDGKFRTEFVYTMSPRSIPTLEYREPHVYDAGTYVFRDGYTGVFRDGHYCLLDINGKESMTGSKRQLHVFGNGLIGAGRDTDVEYAAFGDLCEILDLEGNSLLNLDPYDLMERGDGLFYTANKNTGGYRYFEVVPADAAAAIPGDVSGDGITDIMDAILLNKHLLGAKALDDDARKAADLNGDGKVDADDALAVLKAALGIREEAKPAGTSANLSAKYAAQPVKTAPISEETILGQTKFALDLLRETASPGKNSLVSPYSVSQALGMTANGAAGETREEMENVLGGTMETLNPAFYTLRTRDTKDAKCQMANSIWMRDSFIREFPVSKAFLQTNADYYGADAFAAPFDDTTVDEMNDWVKDKTDGMIPSIIGEIPERVMMYLVNAVTFDAEWEKPYSATQERTFTAADGSEQKADMLYRDDFGRPYYEDAHAMGFRQDYKGGKFYFAAFLPEEGMTPEAYLETLTAESLQKMLAAPKKGKICTELPEFSYDFGANLKAPLTEMGMGSAFLEGPASNFSAMLEGNTDRLCISNVFHKTYIEVTKMGTRAGAATAVEMVAESEPIYIRLNRPFLYMIADTETNLPVFIGIVNSLA